jgi:hypothetical protein
MMDEDGKPKGSWWRTVPGILAAITGIITAVTGLLVALQQVGLFGGEIKKPPPPPPPPPPIEKLLFHDAFERPPLSEKYQILNSDSDRLTMVNGQLVIVAGLSNPGKVPRNLVLLQQQFLEDFTATIRLTMKMTRGNLVGLWYWVDSKNKLILGVHAFDAWRSGPGGRHIVFTKYLNDVPNPIQNPQFYLNPEDWRLGWLGTRQLHGYPTKSEVWYFQLERKGVHYTGRVSIDGVEWQEVGTHTILAQNGRLGFTAVSSDPAHVVENPAEFDDFVVKAGQ